MYGASLGFSRRKINLKSTTRKFKIFNLKIHCFSICFSHLQTSFVRDLSSKKQPTVKLPPRVYMSNSFCCFHSTKTLTQVRLRKPLNKSSSSGRWVMGGGSVSNGKGYVPTHSHTYITHCLQSADALVWKVCARLLIYPTERESSLLR